MHSWWLATWKCQTTAHRTENKLIKTFVFWCMKFWRTCGICVFVVCKLWTVINIMQKLICWCLLFISFVSCLRLFYISEWMNGKLFNCGSLKRKPKRKNRMFGVIWVIITSTLGKKTNPHSHSSPLNDWTNNELNIFTNLHKKTNHSSHYFVAMSLYRYVTLQTKWKHSLWLKNSYYKIESDTHGTLFNGKSWSIRILYQPNKFQKFILIFLNYYYLWMVWILWKTFVFIAIHVYSVRACFSKRVTY